MRPTATPSASASQSSSLHSPDRRDAAVLQQALLYRVIELGSGCAKMWNFKNVLGSVLAARALLETIAVTLDFEAKLQEHYKANDFGAWDELITSHTFATREPELIAELPELAAKNVLTYIDRVSTTANIPVPTANPKRLTGRRESADTRSR